jgi:hypothetical protein
MTPTEESIRKLNTYLRGEIAAVETYDQALEKLRDSPNRWGLEQCKLSHERRVAALRRRIEEAGGHPAESSGPWGAFTRLVEGGARAFGEKAAINVLEQGEDHGLKLYRDDVDALDDTARELVETDLLPAQQATHNVLAALKHSLH